MNPLHAVQDHSFHCMKCRLVQFTACRSVCSRLQKMVHQPAVLPGNASNVKHCFLLCDGHMQAGMQALLLCVEVLCGFAAGCGVATNATDMLAACR